MPTVPSLPGLPDDYTSKFFQGDFVTKYIDGSYRGRVLRCWADDEDLPPEPLPRDHLNRPLLRGEVGIESLKDGALAIVPETSLVLYQREFMRGDIVKRSLFDTQSAIVQSMYSEVRLEHVMTKQKLKEWIPFQSLKSSLVVQHRDTVVFENWIGTIEEVYEEAIIELPDKSLVRITDMSGTMKPGMTHEEMIKRQHNCADPENCEFKPDMELKGGVVKSVRPIIIYVSWNAINQRLSPAEQETCKEPKKIWAGDEMEKLILFSRMRNAFPRDGRSVVFKDPNQESEYGFEPDPNDADGVRVFNVVGSRTKITLRWQNGTTTTDWASDLLPYYHVDDYESWPGEHLMWRGDNGEKRWAVVQKYDSVQRIADLKFMDNGELQTVSAMELDNGGLGMKEYGIGVGNMVLLSVCNHSAPPVVPMLGRYDSQMENMMKRDGLARMADEADRAGQQYLNQGPQGSADPINWFGYVKSLELDGKIVVTLANGEEEIVNLTQCHSISEWQPPEWEDVGGPMEPPYLDEMDTDPNDPDGVPFPRTESQQRLLDEEFGAIPPGLTDLLATLRNQPSAPLGPLVSNFLSTTADFDPWATSRPPADTQDEDEDEDDYEDDDEDVEMRDMDEINRIVDPDTQMEDQTKLTSAPDADEPDFPEAGPSSHRDTRASGSGGGGSRTWENFEVQEEAPEDHKYFSEPSIGAAGKSYHSRIAKEHKTLRTSLPDNIIVRTYENRTDLMRCLIIGPEGTPYADAPFVFDVYLKPGSYPTSPPQVHFHSHTHGKGRCNPNLYEEGKVCLSILGTWHGDSSESWSDKSSLLQVFVSISGLVLVRSPYHCEPAFAKLEGTKEGRVNSRLYSEKAYVLSRSFVKTALERPPGGLDDEIRDIYINEGRLQRVIDHAKPLMEQGEAARDKAGGEVPEEEVWNADAMGSLTMGAILSLKRTISRLEELWAERNDA